MKYYDAEIEYLNCPDETTAGLYRIDFGINMTYGRGFGLTFSDLQFGGTVSNQWGAVAGTTWSTKRVQIYRNPADNQINIDWNNSIALQNRSLDQNKHTIDIKPIINGTQTQLIIDNTVIKNINNFELGGTSADSIKWIPPQSTSLITGKLYRFWIYDTDQSLLLDAIPVRIGSVGYMYDKVSDTLFGNAGTGSFTLGPDVAGWPGMEGTPKVSELRKQILINSLKSSTALPYDAELEYLETTGTQHIKLDISPDITTDACEIYFQQTTNVTQGRFFAGGSIAFYINGSNNFAVGLYSGSWTWQSVNAVNVGTVKRKWKVDYVTKKVYVDDYNVYTYTKALTNISSNVVWVFWDGSTANRHIKGKLFHVKYWKNGELIRDMIPVRKGNVAYMYDKITKKMYGNEGTGSFILGRDRYTKLSSYTRPDYVISEKALLDTRFLPNGNTRAILDYWNRPVDAYNGVYYHLFGARTAYKQNDFSAAPVSYESGSLLQMRDLYGNSVGFPSNMNVTQKRIVYDKNKGNTTATGYYDEEVIYSVTRNTQTFNSRYPMWLGQYNQNSTVYNTPANVLAAFSFKVYDNDTLVRDYTPAIHPDGTAGFFDNVEKHFYPSDNTVPYRPGYVHTSTEGHKFIFFNTGVTDALGYSRNNSDLLSSLIPVKTRRIKIKKDPTYTTKVVEYGCREIIKKGGHTIISSDSTGDVIEVSGDCDHVAILVEGCPFNYDPQVDITDVGTSNYLTFTALEDGTFTFTIGSAITTTQYQYIEYSVDGGTTWIKTNNVANTTITVTTPTVTTGNKVLWRGIGQRTANNNSNTTTTVCRFSSTGQFDVSGNIMSMLYGEDFAGKDYTPTADNYTFRCLFYKSMVVHAHDLCLPIFFLRYAGYEYFLGSCSSLISVPKLHSAKLNTYCYVNMFSGCTSLNTLPYLPAKYLAQYCYQNMFGGCTSLTTIGTIMPALTSLVSTYVFSYMFADCTALTDASGLTINIFGVNYAAQYMFSGCTALTVPPNITATSVNAYCCQYMFRNCTSLVTAPALPATTLNAYCYQYMFSGCTSLVNAPALPATALQSYCYNHMFQNCTSLVTAPALPCSGTIADYAYSNMFQGCTSLINPPALPAIAVNTYGYNGMFHGCTSLATAPELPAIILGTYAYQHMFTNTAITSAPHLTAPIIPASAYKHMFSGCNNLNYIKCTASNISATDCVLGWTGEYLGWNGSEFAYDEENTGVSSTGTFIQRAGVEWPTGVSGIPDGWTIIYLNSEDGKYYTDSACTTLWSNAPTQPYTSKVQYLQNDGTDARILTRLNYTTMDKYEVKFYYSTWVQYAKVFSNYQGSNYNTIGVELCSTNNDCIDTRFNTKNTGGITNVSAPKGQEHVLVGEKSVSITLDGTETAITNTTAGTANGNTIALFATNSTNTTVYAAGMRIYYFKAWYNGTLMRNLIPVRVGTEGAMYDLASGELLENPMSGAFTLGSDIT